MAHHKSAIKRIRQNEKRRIRNRYYKTRIKNLTKAVIAAVEAGDADKAAEAMKKANRELHKFVSKGVIKKNTASRKVSRLQAKVNALSAA
ncbi:30S ribosomal protein S20 [Hydrogenimonas sp. SS33]|uniref:30S ribosomal protein S20 n=1 Tax=Hydrogenimonas leucolamina TaxID=2954236 RepID=UPI00336C1807